MKEIMNPASEQNTKGKNVSVCGDGREKTPFRARFLLTCKDRHGCDVANYQRLISFT
jgi:hypothetical protein